MGEVQGTKGVQPVSSPYTRPSTGLRHEKARWCRGHGSSDELSILSWPGLSSGLIHARTEWSAEQCAGVFTQVTDGGDP